MIERNQGLAAVEDERRSVARSSSAEARLVLRAAIIVARVYDGVGCVADRPRTMAKANFPAFRS
jgi:hypothetical protein